VWCVAWGGSAQDLLHSVTTSARSVRWSKEVVALFFKKLNNYLSVFSFRSTERATVSLLVSSSHLPSGERVRGLPASDIKGMRWWMDGWREGERDIASGYWNFLPFHRIAKSLSFFPCLFSNPNGWWVLGEACGVCMSELRW
jgi:hypothetical protein